MFRQIDDRLRQIPGVRMVAPALYAPMTGDSWNNGIRVQGRPEPGAKEDTGAGWVRVMPGFFEVLGTKIVLGHVEEDTAATRKVAVINEAFAKRFFKNQNPLGQHFGPGKVKYSTTFEVIGVVRDMRYMTYDYKDPAGPMFRLQDFRADAVGRRAYQGGEIWSHYLYNIVTWAQGRPAGHGRAGAQGAEQCRSQSGALRG